MSIRTSPWPAGVPCWVDLMAPDVAAAQAFYSEVLGWTFADTADEYGGYAIAQVDEAAAAGIGPEQPGARLAWTLYMASDDADATAAAVTEAGGTVLMPPGEVGPLGRMFMAVDPTGAPFGVWQAGEHIGAEVVNQPGGLTWEDLRSRDPETAHAFYRQVFGYQTEAMDVAGPGYALFSRPGEEAPMGGMGPMMGDKEAEPHWLVYFGVADADAAVVAAEQAGGSVPAPAIDTPYGRMAGLADPAGSVFWVVETDGQDQPDRSG